MGLNNLQSREQSRNAQHTYNLDQEAPGADWAARHTPGPGRRAALFLEADMYSKVVIPMDGTDAAEKVIPEVLHLLAPGAVIHLLQIVRPMDADEPERYKRTVGDVAGLHLKYGMAMVRWHGCNARMVSAIAANRNVADGIVRYATGAAADLIAMYTRSQSATLDRRFVAVEVRIKAPMDVLVLKEADLTPAAVAHRVWETAEERAQDMAIA